VEEALAPFVPVLESSLEIECIVDVVVMVIVV